MPIVTKPNQTQLQSGRAVIGNRQLAIGNWQSAIRPFAIRYSTFAILWAVAAANAQSGGGFVITKSTLDSGGYTYHTGGGFQVGGTVGQPDAGDPTGGGFVLTGGFWTPSAVGGAGRRPS